MPSRVVVLVGLAFMGTAASTARAALVPIGAEDDGAVLTGGDMLGEAIARAHQIGATRFRMIVRATRGLDAYQSGVATLCAAGFKVQITLTDYYRGGEAFVAQALARWGACVHTWSLWNEPELNIGLRRYGVIHRLGFRLIRRLAPRDRVLIGEVSPHIMLRGLARLDRLPGAGLALHPYQFGSSPRVDPLGVPNPSRSWPGPAGVGALRTIAHHCRHALYVTEFGYARHEQGWWPAALRMIRHVHAREVVAYQLITGQAGLWDTSLFDRDGAPRSGANALEGSTR